MSEPSTLDERIHRLAPEVDPSIRDELRQVLGTLRGVGYHRAVIVMMSGLALRLFRRIYEAAGQPFPSDNLFDVIVRAAKGDPEKGVKGHRILPDALDSPLHTLRIWSNKIDHDRAAFTMGAEEAELVLNAFLSVLKWFHCESGLTTKLPSIYAGAPPDRRPAGAAGPAKVWRPRVCYPLQPAPYFRGRDTLRAELREWARGRRPADRVVSLVAVGGTGKTALTERVLADLGDDPPAGVLVWSFYEEPRTEAFLRAACEYFTGETPASAGGLLERLQTALSADEPHLLVLDGLERVQAEGTTGRPRGELEDPQLRRLLRWLAAGRGTRARALVTSRFSLVDLDSWAGAGHRTERLDDLEPLAARALLRAWGVRGEDRVLDGLSRSVHGHALSLAVLGSYLGHFCGGDPARSPSFNRTEAAADDAKAARLGRILGEYAQALGGDERDLMARLAAFPRGVRVAVLAYLAAAGGGVAGSLAGCGEARLARLLERLRRLGLVFGYGPAGEVTYTAHPFLRDFFAGLLGVPAAEVHEVVRARLAPGLDARPDSKPADPALLDRYEALIEHTRLAGREREAFDLYWYGLGQHEHLGLVLGENVRGLRIVAGFAADGDVETLARGLPNWEQSNLATGWGLYAENLGDLRTARRAFHFDLIVAGRSGDLRNCSTALLNLADVELLAGSFPAARESAAKALAGAQRAAHAFDQRRQAHAYFAAALAALGDVAAAREHYAAATRLRGRPLYSLAGVWEAEFRLACGDRAGAREQAQAIRERCQRGRRAHETALCHTLLGHLSLAHDPVATRGHLDAARDFGARSGDVQVQLRAYRLAADLARRLSDLSTAATEAEAGLLLADSCGFGLHAVELRLALARAHLDAGRPTAALLPAREALDRSARPECRYAWGEADGSHLCGVAHSRLGETDLARQHLSAAAALRDRLGHPELADTRAALDALAP